MPYFDHAATAPMRDEVRAELGAASVLGNPASTHRAGQVARALLESGREAIAAAAGAHPTEVVLTSGGTESVNLALKGLWWRGSATGRRGVVVPEAEHHATLDAVEWLERQGAAVTWIPVDQEGTIDVDAFSAALGEDVAVATALAANNEVGTLQPIARLADAAREAGVPMHVDAVGALGQMPIDFAGLGIDAMSITAHKLGGPVGVGALLVARDAQLEALVHGGGQQRGIRSGTEDVLGAHLFGVAASLAAAELPAEATRLAGLRDCILDAVSGIDGVDVRGARTRRLPGNAHVTVSGAEGEALQFLFDEAGFQVANGSACTAGVAEESHVLRAMGVLEQRQGAVRMTLGHDTTEADVDALIAVFPRVVEQARRS